MMSLSKFIRHGVAPAAAVGLSLLASSSWACGGMFCSSANPVNQAAERILFAKGADGTITTVVEIQYEGDADKFAWVLPIPGIPTIEVSSKEVFERLQQASNPLYQLNRNLPDSCGNFASDGSSAPSLGSGGESSGGPTVTVLDEGTVGPFDYETISVDAADQDPAAVAIRWLETNGYDVGALGPDVLRPYLESGMNLVAFRLTSGASAGSIRPVSLTYKAKRPAIPIRPTAVAANDDMGVMVWVLGEHRAIPNNYKALELNDLLIDWFNPGSTYDLVVSKAADEAGGQGFVTEQAGDAQGFASIISPEWESSQIDNLRSQQVVQLEDALQQLTGTFGNHDGFMEAVREHVPLRAGIPAEAFVTCSYCYFDPDAGYYFIGQDGMDIDWGSYDKETDPIGGINLGAFITAVETEVLGPIEKTAQLFRDHNYVTRLYTTMSADEMIEDPEFDFNPDAEDVANLHVAEQFLTCNTDDWKVELPSGRVVYGTGSTWPFSAESPGKQPFNSRILKYSTSGAPEVLVDNTKSIQSTLRGSAFGEPSDAFLEDGGVADPDSSGGCSYAASPSSTSLAWLLSPLALLGLVSRRKRKLS